MTRIGRIKAYAAYIPAQPCFHLVVEDGHLQLGCWRAVGQEMPDPVDYSRRTIFERVS